MRRASFGEDVIPEEEDDPQLNNSGALSLLSSRPYAGASPWMHIFDSHEMNKILKTRYSEYR